MIPFMENYESILIPILCANNRNVLQVGFSKKENLRDRRVPHQTPPPFARPVRGGLTYGQQGSGTCESPWEARRLWLPPHPPLPGPQGSHPAGFSSFWLLFLSLQANWAVGWKIIFIHLKNIFLYCWDFFLHEYILLLNLGRKLLFYFQREKKNPLRKFDW